MSSNSVKFTVSEGSRVLNSFSIRTDIADSVVIGRSTRCTVSLSEHRNVSSEHVQLFSDGRGNIFLVDLESRNGTFVDGRRLTPRSPEEFKSHMVVQLTSNSQISLRYATHASASSSSSSSYASSGSGQKDIIALLESKGQVLIGRSQECDIVIDHASVSRRHALVFGLERSTGRIMVRDLNSMNGTFINGRKVHGESSMVLSESLFIGRFKVPLNGSPQNLATQLAIRAEGIVKQFATGKVGLHRCSLDINVNSLTAIMGPSGCGKSTLLKVLNGFAPATDGKVEISGLDLNSNYAYLKTLIGYVPQDDIIHKELTVLQCLYYSAKIKLKGVSKETILQKLNHAMRALGIYEIRHQRIDAISGGQRKRVSIATEILNDPLILFLDEPTSPLDPQTIEEFLKILQNLAKNGTAVVMVTHKPEDLHYMNDVIFMAEGGHLIYQGKTNEYLNFFRVKNTVEVYAELAGAKSARWIDRSSGGGRQSNGSASKFDASRVSRPFYLHQYFWLTIRYFNIKFNDRIGTSILLLQAPLIAVIIGLVFKHLTPAVSFVMVVSAIWFGTTNAAREIVAESSIYKRERMYNLGIWPYLFSKITVLLVFSTIQLLLFVAIIMLVFESGDHQVHWNNYLGGVGVLLVISLTSTIFGLFLSSILNTTEKVMSLVPITLIPQIMLSGLITKISSLPVEVLSYLTISRWGNECLNIVQKELVVDIKSTNCQTGQLEDQRQVVQAADYTKKQFYEDYTEFFGSWANTIKLDVMVMFLMCFIFLISAYVSLRRQDALKVN
jgi:ABC-type multidrug transport system ATPase subunit